MSAVSHGLSAVYFHAGRVLLPISVDFVTKMALDGFFPISTPRMRWAFTMIPSGAAYYWIYGIPVLNPSTIFMVSLYIAYKVWMLSRIKVSEASQPHPSVENLKNHWHALMLMLRLPRDTVNTEMVRKKWQEPEIMEKADVLMKEAVQEMRKLYADLQKSAEGLTGQDQIRKMATDLVKTEFSLRFCGRYSFTLFHVYRAVRGLQYEEFSNIGTASWPFAAEEVDAIPFFEEDKKQKEWRKDYNDIIDLFAPLLDELSKLSAGKQEDVQRYKNWVVRDTERQITRPQDPSPGKFRLEPGSRHIVYN